MTTNVPEQSPWAEIAAELRRIADDAEKLAGEPAPGFLSLHIQPYTPDQINRTQPKHYAATVAAVDAVSKALLGKPATTRRLGSGSFHHDATGYRGPLEVTVLQQVADPAEVDPQAEIERLRARVAELEARDGTGLAYSRANEADDPTPVSPARVPLHTGGVVDGGELVDETSAEPCYVPNGFQAPEVAAERRAWCRAKHPGRECSVAPEDL